MYTRKQAEQEVRDYFKCKQEEDRAAYQKKRCAISSDEVKQAGAILATPRVAAAGLEIVKRYKAGDQARPHLQLCNRLTKEEYGVSTETDLPTLDFARYVILYAERLEVNRQLLDLKSRAAACGMELHGINDTNEKFNYQKYERTHAGLQRFLFDLNAEEIWQQLIQRFSADLRELNWYAIRGETSFMLYTDRDAIELNYHEGSLRFVEMRIQEAKKPRKN